MTNTNQLSDTQLLQYSRQIMLPQIDVSGQQTLMDSNVLVLGAGGLGCPALLYLATAGVGTIVIVDHDKVDRSNIQRQILYSAADIGLHKADVASEKLRHFAEDIVVTPVNQLPEDAELLDHINAADLVLDGTDNFAARYRHNQTCLAAKTPLVSGAVIRFEGQVATFDSRDPGSPCYHCLYSNAVDDEQLNCSENGVLGPVAGMIGTVMATEAIKVLLNIGESLTGRLLLLDALDMQWRSLTLRKDKNCPACST